MYIVSLIEYIYTNNLFFKSNLEVFFAKSYFLRARESERARASAEGDSGRKGGAEKNIFGRLPFDQKLRGEFPEFPWANDTIFFQCGRR